jgi:hypothetical protein
MRALAVAERRVSNKLPAIFIEAIQIPADLRYVDGAMMQEESG